jgi:hypothetical protein
MNDTEARSGPAALATAVAASSEPRPAPTEDPFEKLRKLGELRDAGIISPEEFEAKKASIMDAI